MPVRGEIWLVQFNPTVGSEIGKKRPAVVISSDSLGTLPLKLVAPITGWNPRFASKLWHVPVDPTMQNGLSKKSSVDLFQVRSVSLRRFDSKIGVLEADTVEQVVETLSIVVEYF